LIDAILFQKIISSTLTEKTQLIAPKKEPQKKRKRKRKGKKKKSSRTR
jgi:hypothetical protein